MMESGREKLGRWLEAFSPTIEAEHQAKARMLRLLKETESPFSRNQFSPGHFTASAFVVSEDAKEIILIFHKKLQRWLQPGGHIEKSDPDIYASAMREASEELGLTKHDFSGDGQIFDLDIHPIPAHGSEAAHFHYDVRFLFRTKRQLLRHNQEVEEAIYWPIEKLNEIETDESVRRVFDKLWGRPSAINVASEEGIS